MRICGISDMHGIYDFSIEPCNILFICGDIVPLRMQRNIPQSLSWFEKEFIPWCNLQPVDQIYLVAGNHDFFMEDELKVKKILQGTKIIVLYNEGAEYLDEDSGKVYTIWGSPLCHIFGNWAFMYSDEYNKEQYEKMPNGVDFLITHDAAYLHSDQCLGFSDDFEKSLHRGNIPLMNVVYDKVPSFHLFGHLHTCNHQLIDYSGTKTVCVSMIDEKYVKTFQPFYLNL